jgi:hypothetical protein
MITSKDILKQLKSALKQFGTYSFDDKGAHEVMDLDAICAELRSMPAKDAGKVMKQVEAGDKERGQALVDQLASNMDESPEKWFEEVLRVSGITARGGY